MKEFKTSTQLILLVKQTLKEESIIRIQNEIMETMNDS